MNSQERLPEYKNPRLSVDVRVADLLSRMTLEEKVAQLTCLWGNRPQANPQTDFATDRGEFSPTKAAQVMKHGIGQIARQRERKDPREERSSRTPFRNGSWKTRASASRQFFTTKYSTAIWRKAAPVFRNQ